MRRLKKRNECPPEGFSFVHQETGHCSVAVDYHTWIEKCREHRKANGLPWLDNDVFEDQLCQRLHPDLWEVDKGDKLWVDTHLSWPDVSTATRALLDSIRGDYVSQEEAERRAKICVGCNFNVRLMGCGACHALSTLIAKNQSTSFDTQLHSCAICRCYNIPQVHIKLDTLSAHRSPDRQNKYPDFCWQKIDGANYRNDLQTR